MSVPVLRYPAYILIGSLLCGLVPTGELESAGGEEITVGSKKFTENVILGEIVTQLLRSSGVSAGHRRELGGTRVLWGAILAGDIDIYPEYTGTLLREIFQDEQLADEKELAAFLEGKGVVMSDPLGFNNTYAIGMLQSRAAQLGIETISDLKRYPDLEFGFTNEFMNRGDGWPGLRRHYRLPQENVRGMDHDLSYHGLASGSVDAIALYSTDAEISYYDIRSLADDWGFFPAYEAVILYRSDVGSRHPEVVEDVESLEGMIQAEEMIAMNARAKIDGVPEKRVAARFLEQELGVESEFQVVSFRQRLRQRTLEHMVLVLISLTAAILVSIPLGVLAVRNPRLAGIILGGVGIIQTIPSLALLVFMIPLLGIGGPPAVLALFLYSLLPIVRNTYTGIRDIPTHMHESAVALGLPPFARLRLIELPLASSAILAGIKTSAVINVGTATLGALIGAGGYGQPILTGIRLDDIGLILEGAVPAAVLALLVQGGFDLAERVIVPRGLRLGSEGSAP